MILPHHTSLLLHDVQHAFFTRQGGVSEGIYSSLNAGIGSGDNPVHVAVNRARLAGFFGQDASQLLTLKQVHSAVCVTVDAMYNKINRPEADALVTREKGVILGILTADCVPVLCYDSTAEVIGAAHAGWKGAMSGVVQATIAAMQGLGATPVNIRAVIGASISQPSYEVAEDFYAAFLAQDEDNNVFFIPSLLHPFTHYLFDNKAYVVKQLELSGVIQVDILPHDTYAEEHMFYSFRRATHRNEPDYGRQLSAIVL